MNLSKITRRIGIVFLIIGVLITIQTVGVFGLSFVEDASANSTVYVGNNNGSLYAIDASTGQLEWDFDSDGAIRSSPTVVNDIIYVSNRQPNSAETNDRIFAIDASTGDQIWNYTTGRPNRPSPTVINGTVYAGSRSGKIYALDSLTGELKWNFTTGDWIWTSPNVKNNTVFFGNRNGKFFAVNASTGEEKWNLSMGSGIWSSPIAVNNSVFFGTIGGDVYSRNISTGEAEWSFSTGGQVRSSPTIVNETLYIGSRDGNLYALNTSTGTEIWNYSAGDRIDSSPTIANNNVYFGSHTNNVYALNASNGVEKWQFQTGAFVASSPTYLNETVYIGSGDNNLYAIDAITGGEKWNFSVSSTFYSSPTIVPSNAVNSSGSRVLLRTLGHYEAFGFEDLGQVEQEETVKKGVLSLRYGSCLEPNETTGYHVYFTHPDVGKERLNNTEYSLHLETPTILGIDIQNETFTGLSEGEGEISWFYQYNGTNYELTSNISVYHLTLSNIDKLSGACMLIAFMGDEIGGSHGNIQWATLSIFFGVVLSWGMRSKWMGLAGIHILMTVGWIMGFISNGIFLTSMFYAIFLALTMVDAFGNHIQKM